MKKIAMILNMELLKRNLNTTLLTLKSEAVTIARYMVARNEVSIMEENGIETSIT